MTDKFEELLGRPPTSEEMLLKEHLDNLLATIKDVENISKILELSSTLEGQDLLDALNQMDNKE